MPFARHIFLRDHRADGGRIGRPLKRISQPLEDCRCVKMPNFQHTQRLQNQDGNRCQPGGKVTDHHHQLAVVSVHQHACKRGNDQQWRDEKHLHQPQRGGAARLLEDPDRERERAHIGSSTEMICPSQTSVKPNIPVGRFVFCILFL